MCTEKCQTLDLGDVSQRTPKPEPGLLLRSGRRLALASALLVGVGGSFGASPASAWSISDFFGGSDDDDSTTSDTSSETFYSAFGDSHDTAEERNTTEAEQTSYWDSFTSDDNNTTVSAVFYDSFGNEHPTQAAANQADVDAANLEQKAAADKAVIDDIRSRLPDVPLVVVDEERGGKSTLWSTPDGVLLEATLEPLDPYSGEPIITYDRVDPTQFRAVEDYPNGDTVYTDGDGIQTILPAEGNRIVIDGNKATVYRDDGTREETISTLEAQMITEFDSEGNVVREKIFVRQPDGSLRELVPSDPEPGSESQGSESQGNESEKTQPIPKFDPDIKPGDRDTASGDSFDQIDDPSFIVMDASYRPEAGDGDSSTSNDNVGDSNFASGANSAWSETTSDNAGNDDGYQTARVTPEPAECVDSDGDGWGWTGTASCLMPGGATNGNGTPLSTSGSECVDPDGDGWGWTGTASCRVA